MTKNILVLSEVQEGGEWISILRLIGATKNISDKYNFFLIAFSQEKTFADKLFDDVLLIKPASTSPPFSFIKKLFLDIFRAREELKRFGINNDIDLIIVTNFLFILPLFTISKLKRIKIIYLFQGIKSVPIKRLKDLDYRQLTIKFLERLAMFLSDLIIAPSKEGADYVRSALSFLSSFKKIAVIPVSVPKEFFRKPNPQIKNSLKNKLGLRESQKIILYSGRIAKFKGLENLVEGFADFQKVEPKAFLIFAHPAKNINFELLFKLKGRVKTGQLESKVKFISATTISELIGIYNLADVLILPSEIEMAPLVIVEALATQTPCIGTKVGNVGSIMSQIDSQLLLANNSPAEIVRSLNYFFNLSKEEVNNIKKRGLRLVKSYLPEASGKSFLALIRSLRI